MVLGSNVVDMEVMLVVTTRDEGCEASSFLRGSAHK